MLIGLPATSESTVKIARGADDVNLHTEHLNPFAGCLIALPDLSEV